MKAIIYAGHGTRMKEGVEQFYQFTKKVIVDVDVPIQEVGFIEFAHPTIEEAIDKCVFQGATSIAIVPILLLAAGHAKKDLPNYVKKARERYPAVHFTLGKTIGPDLRITKMLKTRLEERGYRENNQGRSNVGILLVGRGSSDPDANSDVAKIARLLWEHCFVQSVEYCYLAATKPTFADGLAEMVKRNYEKIYVLPCLLFSGILMEKMKAKISNCQTMSGQKVVLCDYLGYHPLMVDVVKNRIESALNSISRSE